MIYLNKTTEAQTAFIPRVTEATGLLRLKMRSTVGLDIPVSVAAIDLDVHRLCYQLGITLPEDIVPGEYEYTLTADEETVSTGVMVVTDAPNKPGQYNKEITYEQYEGN